METVEFLVSRIHLAARRGTKNECETENERKNARKITVFRAKVGAFRAFSILFIYPGRFADVSSQNRKCRGVKATKE